MAMKLTLSIKQSSIFLLAILVVFAFYCSFSISYQEESVNANPTLTYFFAVLNFMLVASYILLFSSKFILISRIHKWLFILTLIITIVSIFSLEKGVNFNGFLYRIIWASSPLLFFYFGYVVLSKNDILDYWGLLFLLTSVLLAAYYYKELALSRSLPSAEQHRIGSAYFSMFLLPLVMLNKNRWIRIAALVIAFSVIMSSLKRGGILALVLSFIVYMFIYQFYVKRRKQAVVNGIILFVLVILGLYFAFLYYDNLYDNVISERLGSMFEDKGTGRVPIWEETIRLISLNTWDKWLFGNGHLAVLENSILERSAHNDFLEILYDYGVFAFVSYVCMHLVLIKQIVLLIKNRSNLAPILAMSYTQFFILSTISHIFIYPWYLIFTVLWGSIYGRMEYMRNGQ